MKSITNFITLSILFTITSLSQFYEKTFDLGVRSYGWSIKKTTSGYKMSGVYFDPTKNEFNGMDVFTLDFDDKMQFSKYTVFTST